MEGERPFVGYFLGGLFSAIHLDEPRYETLTQRTLDHFLETKNYGKSVQQLLLLGASDMQKALEMMNGAPNATESKNPDHIFGLYFEEYMGLKHDTARDWVEKVIREENKLNIELTPKKSELDYAAAQDEKSFQAQHELN